MMTFAGMSKLMLTKHHQITQCDPSSPTGLSCPKRKEHRRKWGEKYASNWSPLYQKKSCVIPDTHIHKLRLFRAPQNHFATISSDKRHFTYKRHIKENAETNRREFARKTSFGIIVLSKYICQIRKESRGDTPCTILRLRGMK